MQLPPAGDPKAYKAGLPYQYTLGVIADELNTIGESNGTLINNSRFNGQTYVSAPAPDFEAVSVEWNSRAVAGTVVPVTFEVANAGVLNAETLASFFVSTNDRITTNDLQVGQVRVALAAGVEHLLADIALDQRDGGECGQAETDRQQQHRRCRAWPVEVGDPQPRPWCPHMRRDTGQPHHQRCAGAEQHQGEHSGDTEVE